MLNSSASLAHLAIGGALFVAFVAGEVHGQTEIPPLPPSMVETLAEPVADIDVDDVYFGTGTVKVNLSSQKRLREIASKLVGLRVYLLLEAHTDATGDEQTNLRLSQRRAEAVRLLLIDYGLQPNQLVAVGYGERFAQSIDTAKMAQERRVAITVMRMREDPLSKKQLFVELRQRGLRFTERGEETRLTQDKGTQTPEAVDRYDPVANLSLLKMGSYALKELGASAGTGFMIQARILPLSRQLSLQASLIQDRARAAFAIIPGSVTRTRFHGGLRVEHWSQKIVTWYSEVALGMTRIEFTPNGEIEGEASTSDEERRRLTEFDNSDINASHPSTFIFTAVVAKIPKSSLGGQVGMTILGNSVSIDAGFGVGISYFW